jgi:hypothetical protein
MGSYYLFTKDDLITAYRQYWSQIISENPDSEQLKVCNISVRVASYIYIQVQSEHIFQVLTKGIFHLLLWSATVTVGCWVECHVAKFMKYFMHQYETLHAYYQNLRAVLKGVGLFIFL